MPLAAPSLRSCGCVVPPGQKCRHAVARDKERKARHDATRPSARQRGYDGKWEQARAGFLAKHRCCARCGAPASVVHHSVPHRGDRKLFWDRSKWVPACQPCHDGSLQAAEKREARQ